MALDSIERLITAQNTTCSHGVPRIPLALRPDDQAQQGVRASASASSVSTSGVLIESGTRFMLDMLGHV